MSGFKGTPGPWFVEDNPTIFPAVQVAAFDGVGNRHLQVIIQSHVQEEDARLIAAAPELLEALEDCVLYWDDELPKDRCLNFIGKARAAIAKALGTESDQ